MDNKEGLLQLEKMRKRYVDKETKESKMRLTDLIIVTYKENVLPSYVELYRGAITLSKLAFHGASETMLRMLPIWTPEENV